MTIKKVKVLMIDPPSGWLYGFPLPMINKDKDEPIEDFLLRNGYPQKLIDEGMAKHCRYWETEIVETNN